MNGYSDPSVEERLSRLSESFDWVFFDLDGTLWDHARASRDAIGVICREIGTGAEEFLHLYREVTEDMIRRIESGSITVERSRTLRFEIMLERLGLERSGHDATVLAHRYLRTYLEYRGEFAGASRVVERLAHTARLAVLTNASHETQDPKIAQLSARGRFDFILTTDETDCLKPHPRFYELAEERAGNPDPSRILMIGDSWENDVAAPHQRGYSCVWIGHPGEEPEELERVVALPEIGELLEYLADPEDDAVGAAR